MVSILLLSRQYMTSNMAKKALLVVSYGTSYIETREKTIGAVEKAISAAYPDRELRRAFTARMVIDIVKRKEGLQIDFIRDALQRLYDEGFDDVLVQSTHITNGGQYDFVAQSVNEFKGKFAHLALGVPLLTTEEDYDKVVDTIIDQFYPKEEDSALVIMGHGTVHYANATYCQLMMKFWYAGYRNVYVTTAGIFPDFDQTAADMKGKGYKKVTLLPLLVVAGDHVTNDVAGTGDNSLYTAMKKEGYEVTAIAKGLGENPAFQKLFVAHALEAKEI